MYFNLKICILLLFVHMNLLVLYFTLLICVLKLLKFVCKLDMKVEIKSVNAREIQLVFGKNLAPSKELVKNALFLKEGAPSSRQYEDWNSFRDDFLRSHWV